MTDKSKKILWTLAKVLVLCLVLWMILGSLKQKTGGDYLSFWFQVKHFFGIQVLVVLMILAIFNRFFEIIKWQLLAQTVQRTSVGDASKQVLSALAFAVITPNGIGEYAAKTIFFEKSYRKTILFLNVLCNGSQLLMTLVWGIIGLGILQMWGFLWGYLGLVLLVLIFVCYFKELRLKGLSIVKFSQKLSSISVGIKWRVMVLALGRFVLFSHQYVLIFYVLGAEAPYWYLLSGVFAMYLLSSSLPSFQFLEFLIRGGVGLLVFEPMGIADQTVLFASVLVWLLNVVLPILIGLIIITTLKLPKL